MIIAYGICRASGVYTSKQARFEFHQPAIFQTMLRVDDGLRFPAGKIDHCSGKQCGCAASFGVVPISGVYRRTGMTVLVVGATGMTGV